MKIAAVLLIVLGLAGILYGGFTYTTQKKVVDMGPVQIDKKDHHSVPIPPILGVVALVGGGLLLFMGGKEGR